MKCALDQKVAAMNAATGSAKVEAMARVINGLVSKHKEMERNMMTMHSENANHNNPVERRQNGVTNDVRM